MWTILAAACGAIAGGLLVWEMARRDMEATAREMREYVITLRAEVARLRQPRDVRGRFLPKVSAELDAMLTEADAAAALDSAP
jgi:hypothetical protein